MNRIALLGWRALRLRCPNCGGPDLFRTWFAIRPTCPTCGIHLERREPGYQVGAYMFNVAASEGTGVLLMASLVVATWPNPPWNLVLWGGAGLMILMPILFYPFSKTMFLAFDLIFRPAGNE